MSTSPSPAMAPPSMHTGVIQVTAGAAMISFSPVFVNLAHVGPTAAGFYRMLFGGMILWAAALVRRERLWHGFNHFLQLFICSIFFSLDLAFWHRSVYYVGPGLATLLANFQVFFLAGFGILALGERPTWKTALSVPLAVAGLYLVVGINWAGLGSQYKIGIVFGLIAALCYSAYILALRRLLTAHGRASKLADITLISLLTAGIMGPWAWAQGEGFGIPDLQSWGALVGYGLIPQVLGWLLISTGIVKIDASRAGLLLLLQPTLAFVWDILFFARPTGLMEILGALVTLFSIYLGTISLKRR
ncbi:MAG: DMT family transporter [Deltaproteobacteria bacterium]|nr:DMT family transporter [Deltaproteobacteria bacterium]